MRAGGLITVLLGVILGIAMVESQSIYRTKCAARAVEDSLWELSTIVANI